MCDRKSVEADHVTAVRLLQEAVNKHTWTSGDGDVEVLKPVLMRLCVRYLYHEKRRGYALDSVGMFRKKTSKLSLVYSKRQYDTPSKSNIRYIQC